jgi:hypothetical protein
MEHLGTTSEHSSQNAAVDKRQPFNYCSICNGWFPRQPQSDEEREQIRRERDA